MQLVTTVDTGVVMVSFLFRNVRNPAFRLVVVDNASTDGSAAMLAGLADAGLCEVILNPENRYHGPALNQGIEQLRTQPSVRYVLVLDSDCVVLRPDTLSAAVDRMAATGAGLVGQWMHDQWHDGDLMGLHCLLLDLTQVWRDPIARF